jgi:hypothetical protein
MHLIDDVMCGMYLGKIIACSPYLSGFSYFRVVRSITCLQMLLEIVCGWDCYVECFNIPFFGEVWVQMT